ncbi:hypothetical protein F9V36_14620 [Escherichia coli]|nr:hypothetical protein [Escherichia coli]EFE2059394.1 hypothetical protein [Escherichia coli]EFE7601871.1 hypothetical protein [Escherichia coli]NNQ20314.1 hypothetical protein [Escherichia coli]NNQ25534.1 hypothetical protein [Escherichia coli]
MAKKFIVEAKQLTFPVVNPVFLAIDTIPVFPHMMWGFFLSSICLLLNALQMICFRYTSVS